MAGMSAPDILDLIDGALADNGTSDDAMRWTPDPPPAPLPAARRRVPGPPPALLVEICALTGYDGYTADAIARHAKTHGLASPYADVVAQAGRNVLARGQAELAKLLVDRLTPVVRSITAGLTGFFDQLAAGVRAAVGLLSKLLPPQVPPPPARPARVSAMHTAYHHRHRGARRWQ
jgi:hypothetical protein